MYTNIGDKNNLYRTGTPSCHTIIIQLKLKHRRGARWKERIDTYKFYRINMKMIQIKMSKLYQIRSFNFTCFQVFPLVWLEWVTLHWADYVSLSQVYLIFLFHKIHSGIFIFSINIWNVITLLLLFSIVLFRKQKCKFCNKAKIAILTF